MSISREMDKESGTLLNNKNEQITDTRNKKDESQNIKNVSERTQALTRWFHLYETLEKTWLIDSAGDQDRHCLGAEMLPGWKGKWGKLLE